MTALSAQVAPQDLIPVFQADIGGVLTKACDARLLHAFLEVGKDFTTWIKARIAEYGFLLNIDYLEYSPKSGNKGKPKIEYTLALDMGKELSMVEKNEKGRQARKYFINCERLAIEALTKTQYGLKRLPEPPAITKAQTGILYNKVCAIAGGDNKIRAAVWKRFQNKFTLSSYKDLPAEKFEEAVIYLEAKQEEYRQGVEMLYISTKELDLLVRERLAALPAPAKEGRTIQAQHNSVTLILKPLEDGELIKRWMVTQHGGDMVQLWAVGSPSEAMAAWHDEGYIVIKKDDVSARKLANDYLPYYMLLPIIEAASQRLQRIGGGNRVDG